MTAPVLVVTDDATPDQLRAAITALRDKQRRAVIPSTAAEVGVEIDALLDRLAGL